MSVTAPTQQDEAAELALSIVVGVARLGEADLKNWWSSHGLDPEVQFALSGFPMTGKYLGAELALLSAKRRHEQLLRRESAIHLFSPALPFLGWSQAYLAERKTDPCDDFVDELLTSNAEDVRRHLGDWLKNLGARPYPNRSISRDDLHDRDTAAELMASLGVQYLELRDEFIPPHLELSQ